MLSSALRITSEDEHSAKFAVPKRAGQWSRGRAESSVQPQQWMNVAGIEPDPIQARYHDAAHRPWSATTKRIYTAGCSAR
jgi:hypothetical protein